MEYMLVTFMNNGSAKMAKCESTKALIDQHFGKGMHSAKEISQ
jgi:hypothetical protein